MRDRIPPAPNLPNTVNAAPDEERDSLLADYPWMKSLEPFYIDWELIWFI